MGPPLVMVEELCRGPDSIKTTSHRRNHTFPDLQWIQGATICTLGESYMY